ncbi:MAG: UDP-N-acetylmuramoyl-tripeptide--D-alanyl-D-alanine ligase [Lachnospiraceae bacterium]|nr:UDP-N-acetylmuramoyl-tripeptide--D-alanyl-D-alanine ligase [Lachnospiraceae bacterium]
MKNLTLANIVKVCNGVWHGDEALLPEEVQSVTTDSRQVSPGCLFVPIVGERADGHDFIPQAAGSGALASLSEKELSDAPVSYIQVESSLQAVKDIAAYYLEQLGIPVVGVTGSAGKTSTKEMIASVLAQKYQTLKTQGNFNNELGVPLTVFRLRDEDQIAVIEMGINHFGEMSRLASITRPDTGVITNIGTAHLEFLGDRDGILRAKTEMLDYIRPGGHIVLNGDDDKLRTVRESHGIRPVFYGLDPKNDVYADNVKSHGLKGTSCRIHSGEDIFEVTVPIPGIHMVYNALSAAAVGSIYGLSASEIRRGIETVQSIGGRFHLIETENLTIVDDCYNASPSSMMASLDVLKESEGRRVAVLGDMAELGENERALHREVGRHAAGCGIDSVICVGDLCGDMAEEAENEARKNGLGTEVLHEKDRDSLIGSLREIIRPGDTVLVKASHCMGFEKIVEALKEL